MTMRNPISFGMSLLLLKAVLIVLMSKLTKAQTAPSDECNSYTILDQPWRATSQSAGGVSDAYFSWNGWYRLLHYGMNIRMPEHCVQSGCTTSYPLWLNGTHPQLEDGVVSRQVCYNYAGSCCSSSYQSYIRIKACPGNFFIYEFKSPATYYSAYCTDITTLSPANFSTAIITTGNDTSTNSSFDPCQNYTAIDNYWRNIYTDYGGHDDTLLEWTGWYRLYLQGQSAHMSEWCVYGTTCGGYTPLMLRGLHPQIGDGVVTRDVFGSSYTSCDYYKSNPIQVKACPGNYYVYKLVKPNLLIPVPSYCAVVFSNSSTDPCYSYTILNDPWRSNNNSGSTNCDVSKTWSGWYRFLYQGLNIRMPESCVDEMKCGTYYPLWLNGPHPTLEEGVVVRQVCGSINSDCCYFKSYPIQVKACPGNYYVYELIRPRFCYTAYCTDINTINMPVAHPVTPTTNTMIHQDPVGVIGIRIKVVSSRNLTELFINGTFIKQLQEELVRRGVQNITSIQLRHFEKTNP